MKDSLKNAISLDRKAYSNRYLKKRKKTVSSSRNKIFFKYWPPANCSNGFQKNVNERISFPLNRKSVATDCNKDLFGIFFQKMEKGAPNGNNFWDIETKWFPLARKSISRMKDLLKDKFTLYGKKAFPGRSLWNNL